MFAVSSLRRGNQQGPRTEIEQRVLFSNSSRWLSFGAADFADATFDRTGRYLATMLVTSIESPVSFPVSVTFWPAYF
jgi:curli biogenesis system outer membrane secretion channel CsgG